MKFIGNLVLDYWPVAAPIIYEILARLWPTKWNISILDNVWKFINAIVPNKRLPDGTEKLEHNAKGQFVNKIKVRIGKHVLRVLIPLLFVCNFAEAQIWQNFKGVRLVNNSDTTKQLAVQGSIFYDDVNDKFWGRNNFGWKQFTTGAPITASNGLTKVVNDIKLGGALTANTTVTLPGINQLLFHSIGEIGFDGDSRLLQGNGQILITTEKSLAPTENIQLSFFNGALNVVDNNVIKTGIKNSATGYVTNALSLVTKEYADTKIDGTMALNNIPFGADANSLTQENALQYLTANNQILLTNTALTHTTSLFGGELQFDQASPLRDLTINNAGMSTTGGLFTVTVSGGNYTITNTTSDIILNPASNVRITPGGQLFLSVGAAPIDNTATLLAQNQSTGAFATRNDIASNTFTPTLGNANNISSSNVVAGTTTYLRIGNFVQMKGAVNVTPTASGSTCRLTITLPFTTSSATMSGLGVSSTSGENEANVISVLSGTQIAQLEFIAISTTASVWNYDLQYQIQ